MIRKLVSLDISRKIDEEAQTQWGFNSLALIEAAGRACVQVLHEEFPYFFTDLPLRILVLAGSGNNGADALLMLRYMLLSGLSEPGYAKIIVSRFPPGMQSTQIKQSITAGCKTSNKASPMENILSSLQKMQVPAAAWNESPQQIDGYDIILDGIAGTGARGPLEGSSREMVQNLNALTAGKIPLGKPLVVSVDLPSGLSDEWKPGMPIVRADLSLAIEPRKYCLYNPSARPWAGTILPVGGIFPLELVNSQNGAEFVDWEYGRELLPALKPQIHKYQRGTVEIQAGSVGYTGAAFIAARGAQAAGAGLVRLVVDPEIYPILASRAAGIMVVSETSASGRFKPDALLLGSGWGRGAGRSAQLEKALVEEENGTPLVLDADGIALAKEKLFHGNTLLTPHVGEFAEYTGTAIEDILNQPVPVLLKTAEEKNVFILLKSHVMFIAAPDGRLGIVDGMMPNLASGGSGDLLSGFCAAFAGRMFKEGKVDLYACAAAAASLFIYAGKTGELSERFTDPLELADRAAYLAGKAWLINKPYIKGKEP